MNNQLSRENSTHNDIMQEEETREVIYPAFNKNNIPVCLACSNEYSPYACVTINSIIENSSTEYNYDIVVLNTDITEHNISLIMSLTENRDNISIRFFNVKEVIGERTFYVWHHFTDTTYYRLLVPDMFYNYSKVIYIDSDIIVNHDLLDLYNVDVEGWLLAAAIDTHVAGRLAMGKEHPEYAYFTDKLGITGNIRYYQCGVMLYNVEEFRKTTKPGELLDEASQKTLKWLDQDYMNLKARGKIKTLDNRWNVMVFNNAVIDEKFLTEDDYENYFNARKDPYIVHYIGRSMACFKPEGDFYNLYWKYSRKTPYYERLLSIMMNVKISAMYGRIKKEEAEIENARKSKSLKGRLKNKIIMPVANVIFPKGSKRRERIKKMIKR